MCQMFNQVFPILVPSRSSVSELVDSFDAKVGRDMEVLTVNPLMSEFITYLCHGSGR